MISSITVNYIFGRIIAYCLDNNGYAKYALIGGIVFNIMILYVYKYLNFTISNINILFDNALCETQFVLPLGISFFTFQAMSYIVDVYRNTVVVQKNLFYLALYISFFPQLIAGPIVRYNKIETQIHERKESFSMMGEGIRRFLIGFSKKVILANNFAIIADQAFAMIETDNISVAFAWIGSLAYTFQIFCDFSAYSDMAIGLGKMFGFDFQENFNYPYVSHSISEFWRRWHISLGTWFRDYVYFPLGGSRVQSSFVLIRNLFVVWMLTGIWHGANWTFILWGLMYFVLISFEKITNIPKRCHSVFFREAYRVFTFMCVNIGWVIFRADNLSQGVNYLAVMFGNAGTTIIDNMAIEYFCDYFVLLLFGAVYSIGTFKYIRERIGGNKTINTITEIITPFVYLGLFIVSVSYLVIGAHNPFIYFNF